MLRKKKYVKDKYSIINAVSSHEDLEYFRGNKYYIKRISFGIGEGEWLVWNMITSYMPAVYVKKNPFGVKWEIKQTTDTPTWNDIKDMNCWERENWIEKEFGDINNIKKTRYK